MEKFLAEKSPQPAQEDKLVAGSWVYGTFSTWIGDPDKNRGWEILVEAKRTFDEQVATRAAVPGGARGGGKTAGHLRGIGLVLVVRGLQSRRDGGQFDQLYRMHLANLYLLLNVEAPAYLSEVISRGGGKPSRGGVMRHHSEAGG